MSEQTLLALGCPPTLDEDAQKVFRFAARHDVLPLVAAYLAYGMDVDAVAGTKTALIGATEDQELTMMRFLIAAGADLDARDRDGDTALHTAANWKHLDALASARALVAAGTDVNAAYGPHGYTPLYYSIVAQDVRCAMGLIFYAADIHARVQPHHRPLLTCALLKKQWDIAKVLIAAGADLNAVDDLGWTPWCVANYLGWTPWRGLQFLYWDSWNMPAEDKAVPEEERKNLVATAGLLGWMNWPKVLSAARNASDIPGA